MSTIANNVAAKLSVVFVAAAMLFTVAAPAQAQSAEELQQMINDLLSQVASLQGQLGGGGSMSASGVCPYTWTRSLNIGASGMDVMKLQQFLNADAETRIAATGVGSAGQETEYYGSLTGAAVAKFQTRHRADILTPLGLVNATTYFGPSTMAKANSLCASAMPGDSMGDDTTGDDDDDSSSSAGLSGGESSLSSFEGSDGDDTDLEEGQNDAPVAEFEFDVEDGDIEISRIDLVFVGTGEEDEPWDTFEDISIWIDGDKIAEENADSKSDWEDDDPTSDEHRMRFTGVDAIFREGDTASIVVGVSVQGSVDGTSDGEEWEVYVPEDGIRGRDGAGIDQYVGESDNTSRSESVDFEINEEGGDDELNIQTSSADPDATPLAVEDNTNSDWHTVFAIDLDTDDSVNDIAVDTAVFKVIVQGDQYNQVVNDAQLVIDGDVYDDYEVTDGNGNAVNGDTATATLTFDLDLDLVIDAGDEVTAELQLEFKKLNTNYIEGQTVQATTTATGWSAEGADDLTVGSGNQLSGSASGEVHTLRTEGIVLEPGDSDSDTSGTNDTTGSFTLEFEVTAFENDFYIAAYAATTTALVGTNGGAKFTVEGPVGFLPGSSTISGVLSSTADEDTVGVFTVSENTTETFTLTVSVDPNVAGQYRVVLDDILFTSNSDGTSSLTTDQVNPASDFRAPTNGYETINQ